MKKQILFVLIMMYATCAMAVSLPSTSYHSYNSMIETDQTYTVSTGTTFVNQAVVGSYSGSCQPDPSWQLDINKCKSCCTGELISCDGACAGNTACEQACMQQNADCHAMCGDIELGQPLDAPVFFLLALIAAYGAFAVYRRKMA